MNFTKLTKEEQLTILANVAEEKGSKSRGFSTLYRFPIRNGCHGQKNT